MGVAMVDLMSEVDTDVDLGMSFRINDEKLYANATATPGNKLSEPNLRLLRYTSCSRPDERVVINEEERTILLENSPEPIPYQVRRDNTKQTQNARSFVDSPRSHIPPDELVGIPPVAGLGKGYRNYC